MESALLSRSSLTGSSGHKDARKKSSFMSFKERTFSSSDYLHSSNTTSSPLSSPLSNSPRYFDRYPRRPSASPTPRSRPNGRPSSSPTEEDVVRNSEYWEEAERAPKSASGGSYPFPANDPSEDALVDFPSSNDHTPRPHTRLRTRSGPSSKERKSPSHVPPLRFSGTSTLETPPRTPIELPYTIRPSIERYPGVVGVDAMDALVDGMNGFETPDFSGSGSSSNKSKSKSSRSRFAKIPNHHPLYQPPLPKPPPGIVLGGGKERRSSESEDEEDSPRKHTPSRRHRSRNGHPSSAQSTPKSVASAPLPTHRSSDNNLRYSSLSADTDELSVLHLSYQSDDHRKSIAPSISDIIRAHAPQSAQIRNKPAPLRTLGYSSHHPTLREETESEPEPEPLSPDEEAELITRSSIDSIAREVQQTLRNQTTSKVIIEKPARISPVQELSIPSDGPTSPRSPNGKRASSIFSAAPSTQGHMSMFEHNSFSASPISPSQAIAQYLRSTRLTTLLKLTRYPHATREQPLTVSLSDLGRPDGFPVVMFLGLGCVRHIMGLYDEMADILGLRLITIDRWGLGRTETPRAKSARGIMEWGSVVEEVLDMLNIEHCSVMAHSAGAPYALSFASRAPDRIRGDICLLAPWVGGSDSGGYKWLKYVPNGILKTAQAAEWKMQAWMIGKPPTIAYEGIGYNAVSMTPTRSRKNTPRGKKSLTRTDSTSNDTVSPESQPRPSIDSNFSSEYDDLRDFDGRFESRSTLGAKLPSVYNGVADGKETKRVSSRGFLKRLKSGSGKPSFSTPPTPTEPSTPTSPISASGRKLKGLRSMGSLRGKTSSAPSTVGKQYSASSPKLPETLKLEGSLLDEGNLTFGDVDWSKASATAPEPFTPPPSQSRPISSDTTASSSNTSDTLEWAKAVVTSADPSFAARPVTPRRVASELASVSDKSSSNGYATSSVRGGGRRSISFSVAKSSPSTVPTSPVASTYASPHASGIPPSGGGSYQAALGNALIAASHAESAKGTHNDFLQILNHDNRPWGFQYASYPHKVRVWYGDKDEKIAENAVRWMERTMGEERCQVKVVKGADHALMYKSAVVIEVLERIREQARVEACTSWYTTIV